MNRLAKSLGIGLAALVLANPTYSQEREILLPDTLPPLELVEYPNPGETYVRNIKKFNQKTETWHRHTEVYDPEKKEWIGYGKDLKSQKKLRLAILRSSFQKAREEIKKEEETKKQKIKRAGLETAIEILLRGMKKVDKYSR